ncbi:polar amino acid transport system substrate-binding protein [Inhella inkyongensis]|uniref:Polar amino acid transport system substrate-binding protein n=1 Tax=Inhella inkyongensis TaxID=392593 RepID=A0A840S0F8_9BURK|nr:transporter substrate-binding domain-containing protein [Inhella inkyongensis]MBB5204557.1 polar amino acid transport system substrate-binding protein [Inhella inkyongensis]
MKLCLLYVLLICALLPQARAAEPPLMRVCMAEVEHAPWRIAEADGRVRDRGLDFQLIEEFRRLSGWRIQVQLRPGKRCLVELQQGSTDANVGLSHTEERALYLRYPPPAGKPDPALALRVDRYALYRRPGSAVHWNGQKLSLPGGAVATQLGHAIAVDLRAMGVPVDERARNTAAALELLLAGEVAAAALHQSDAEAIRRQRPEFAALEMLSPPLAQKPYFVVFSQDFARRHEADLETLWRHFRAAAQLPAYRRAAP